MPKGLGELIASIGNKTESNIGGKKTRRGDAATSEFDPEQTWDNWASVGLSNALIFCPDRVFAVDSFEPANCKMTSSHLLKMFDKRVVHGSAA
jgi:hypothetical protein